MRVLVLLALLCAVQVDSQFWNYPQEFLASWFRQGKTGNIPSDKVSTPTPSAQSPASPPTTTIVTTKPPIIPISSVKPPPKTTVQTGTSKRLTTTITTTTTTSTTTSRPQTVTATVTKTTPVWTTVPITTQQTTTVRNGTQNVNAGSTTVTAASTEPTTFYETTTHDVTATTEEPRDNHRTHDFYLSKREKPQIQINQNATQNLIPLPAGASAALVKPTKYHYYPHNQHIYLLPECAIQQVCNAVYVRLNWTQPLCACPSRYRDPCSASLNSDDQHTTELMTDRKSRRALTLVKTCESTGEMRVCRSPRDWSLLALQNIRTGKSHYLVICRCPESSILEGPMSHDQPTYASVPGIRVYGMMCVDNKRRGRPLRNSRSLENPPFPWKKAIELAETALWD